VIRKVDKHAHASCLVHDHASHRDCRGASVFHCRLDVGDDPCVVIAMIAMNDDEMTRRSSRSRRRTLPSAFAIDRGEEHTQLEGRRSFPCSPAPSSLGQPVCPSTCPHLGRRLYLAQAAPLTWASVGPEATAACRCHCAAHMSPRVARRSPPPRRSGILSGHPAAVNRHAALGCSPNRGDMRSGRSTGRIGREAEGAENRRPDNSMRRGRRYIRGRFDYETVARTVDHSVRDLLMREPSR